MQVTRCGSRLQIGPQAVQYLLAMTALAGRQREHRHQRSRLSQSPLAGLDGDAVDLHSEGPEQLDAQLPGGRLHDPPLPRPRRGLGGGREGCVPNRDDYPVRFRSTAA